MSWAAQWQSMLLHGVVALLLLLTPWPGSYTLVWVLLLTLVVMEGVRSQKRILSRVGLIELRNPEEIVWHQRRWVLVSRPWISRRMMLLSLRSMDGKRTRLWLFFDSMAQDEWRMLRQHMLSRREPNNR